MKKYPCYTAVERWVGASLNKALSLLFHPDHPALNFHCAN